MKKTIILLAACLIALLCAGWALAEEGVLTLPEGLTRVEEEAFYGVKGARSAVVPQGVTEIGDRAFAESGFTEIRLPATVTAIGDGAFRNCGRTWEKARYYFLPNGVNANASALEGCKADVYFDGQKLPYFQYTVADGGVTIMGMNGQLTEVVIPDTIEGKPVVAIGDNTFSGKSAMTGVTIPATVTSIGLFLPVPDGDRPPRGHHGPAAGDLLRMQSAGGDRPDRDHQPGQERFPGVQGADGGHHPGKHHIAAGVRL